MVVRASFANRHGAFHRAGWDFDPGEGLWRGHLPFVFANDSAVLAQCPAHANPDARRQAWRTSPIRR